MKKIFVICGVFLLFGLGYVLGSNRAFNFNDVAFDDERSLSVELLSFDPTEFEDSDQYEVFFELFSELISTHQELNGLHQNLRSERQEVQTMRHQLRDSHVRINREDGMTLWNTYHDLMDLKDEFQKTKGLAYQRLIDLKDSFNKENINIIIQTVQEVLVVLNQRM